MSDVTIFGRAVLDRLTALEISLFGGVANYSDITNFERAVLARIGALEVQKFGSVTVEPDTTSFTRAVLDRLTALEGAGGGGGGGGGAAVTYDTSIGNGVDSLGITDLPLRAGAVQYFAGNGGSDANNGLTHATRLATLGGAFSKVVAGNGDQILVAEGSTFTEDWGTGTAVYPTHDGGTWLANKSGFSPTYPTAVRSYDPADPTNTAKYGRAYQRGSYPTFTGAQTQNSNGTWAYFAVQGIKFSAPNPATDNRFLSFEGAVSYLLIEANYFANTQLTCETQADSTAGPFLTPTNLIIRNNVFDTPWDVTVPVGTGRVGALLIDGFNGITWEDNFVYHNGWGASQTRATIYSQQDETHPIYESPDCTNFIGRRNLIIDPSADGGGARGDGHMTENVIIGSSGGLGLGPPSTEINWRMDGLNLRASYNLIISGVEYSPGGGDLGLGFSSNLGKPGSSIDHNLVIRKASGASRQGTVYSNIAWASTSYRSYMEIHHNISFDWNDSGFTSYTVGGGAPSYALPFTTYDYNSWDDPASGTNVNSGALTFPNAYTEAALYVAAGYANKAALVAAMLANPTLHVQRTLRSLAFAGYGQPIDDAHKADQTAPVLSAATASSPSAGNATIGVTTNEGNGILYYELLTTPTPPHVSQIKMGVDASHAAGIKPGSLAITSTGAKSINLSSVTPGTYYVHFVHEDAAGNKSTAATSISFTVASASATWAANAGDYALSNGNLTALRSGTGTFWGYELTTTAKASGTVDFTIDAMGSAAAQYVGFNDGTESGAPGSNHSMFWRQDGALFYATSTIATLASWTAGDKLRIVKAAGNFTFYKWNGSSWVQQGAVIDSTSVTYSLGTVMAGACYPSLASFNNTGFQVTADFSAF